MPTPRALPEPAPAEAADDAPAAAQTPAPSAWLAELAALFADRRAAFNTLDQRTGDGDLGTNLAGGMAAAVRRARAAEPTLADDLTAVAGAFLDDVGGSSGPLFGLLFQQLAGALTVPGEATEAARLAAGLRAGLAAVSRVGGAQPGDRTLLDALHPAAFDGDAPRGHLDEAAVAAALAGAAATRDLVARRGRASYLGERVLGTPDPGAVALAGVLLALLERHDGEPKPALRADLEELTR
ncbi:DAK2 domain-containing protein [Streptomyces chisholmiae]|uniref:DAK2 domain-containing protein n=1 Tax=Streptomyces chisholmiae TaxID=3075540 RepID=UPI00374E172F